MRLIFSTVLAGLACAFPASAGAQAAPFHFTSIAEGQAAILQPDGFFDLMGPYELKLRAANRDHSSRADVQSQFRGGVIAWNSTAQARVTASLDRIAKRLAPFKALLPAQVDLVAVDANVEDGLPHTRGQAIFLPPAINEIDDGLLDFVMAHEIFHILSRASTADKDKFYATIGFQPCKFAAPRQLAARHITNPDAMFDSHYVAVGSETFVPYVFGKEAALIAPLQLNENLMTRLVSVRVEQGRCTPVESADGAPILKKASEVPTFFNVVGKDSTYVSHPEELLADNFALLVTNQAKSKSPDRLLRIEAELTAAAVLAAAKTTPR